MAKKYVAFMGIEHLMTGAQVGSTATGQWAGSFTFERESASVIRVSSSDPFVIYWPMYGSTVESYEVEEGPEVRHGHGEAQWYGQVMAEAMRKAEDHGVPNLPGPVVQAMRNKHGKDAHQCIKQLTYDRLNGCWFYTWEGMMLGVEPDGYIHS